MATKTVTTPEELRTLEAYAFAKAKAAEAVAQEAAWKDAVVSILGAADEIVVDGATVVTFREVESSRFDVTGIKKADPETYAKYLVSSVARRFLWKGISSA